MRLTRLLGGHLLRISAYARYMVVAMLLLALCALTGCATIRAERAEQEKYQAMSDRITEHFRARRVFITVQRGMAGAYQCRTVTLELGVDGRDPRGLLAHELGHHVLGHCGSNYAQELAANAFAVEALQVLGLTRAEAVRETVRRLLKVARSGYTDPAHNWCAEAADVLRRYSMEPDPRAPGDPICAAELAAR